ncbi:MFS transporter [SAR202 cluster bacterium AC-647-N09_OGT_505m]|nr:MFS transporter [SAR202 cluster bacterium AC-647-N09_OGT_505m]
MNRNHRVFYGWYIVGASVLLNSYLALAVWQGFTVFFLPILRDFGISRTLLSGAFSIRQLESGFLSPLVGFLVDRVGPRKVILTGVLLAGFGLILTGLSTNIWWFYLAFVLMSAGVSGASHGVSWAVMVARWFTRKRGRATSLAFMGGAIGGPGVILVAKLVEAIGWRSSVLILGLGLWMIGIPLSLVARSRPQDYGYEPDGDQSMTLATHRPNGIESQRLEVQTPTVTLREALKGAHFWALVVILGTQQISMGGLQAHQIAYFQDIGFSPTQAASTVAIAFGVSAIGRLAAGILTDWMDWRRVFAAVIIGQMTALLILANVSLFWHALLFSLVLGFCHGMMVPIRPIIAGKLFGTRNLGSIWGAIDGAVVATGVVGPIYLGWTFDSFNTYVPAFYILVTVLVIAIPTVFIAFNNKGISYGNST